MKFIQIFILLFLSTLQIFSQVNLDISNLQKHYEAFEYSTIVIKSEALLLDKERFTKKDLIQIYTLKAASHFSMNDSEDSRKSFIEILKLDENFELNNSQYSPKLVAFFDEVKKEFLDILEEKNKPQQIKIIQPDENIFPRQNKNEINIALAKSILMPGLGHLHLNENSKGWILTSISTVNLASMIYFIFDANKKEENYLAQTNQEQIKIKYDAYNKSYKIRNVLIGTYAAIWLYSQIDILFFSNELGSEKVLTNFQNQQNSIIFSFNFTL
ncbi:MAG: hypothetical protein IPM32_02660 [Ignavibacteriae bacterium]|nr:hypothetical protein [Ignavibacteriota bacterium]